MLKLELSFAKTMRANHSLQSAPSHPLSYLMFERIIPANRWNSYHQQSLSELTKSTHYVRQVLLQMRERSAQNPLPDLAETWKAQILSSEKEGR